MLAIFVMGFVACSNDDGDGLTPAQKQGVGAACTADADCSHGDFALECLPFKGGYCGLEGCKSDIDCPSGSGCVAHDDGKAYCFLQCTDKPQCNYTRPPEIESNCSSKVDFVSGQKDSKACVPPS
jgi:hypothetical protein